ncbi:MAG: FkbM family methyltransferase [Verrucomicrobia bacterium]|nr:FkbM family methyltransferase [Verrucomicrobiota bacterium]
MKTSSVRILDRTFAVYGDDNYLREIGDVFEPDNVAYLKVLCDADSRVLDVGANIGMTALALSQICPRGQIAAIEPLPHTFRYLQQNVAEAGASNLKIFNFALGNLEGSVPMQGHPSNFACSFIADNYRIAAEDHFSQSVPVRRLDNVFSELYLDRLDFMKVDVEGFELEVFAGAKEILNTYQPIVFLEMNHWCLNIFRRLSIPEFRERLMNIFPYVYAIDGLNYLDYVDERNVHHINYHHVLQFRFMNLVAGFDREEILFRLSGLRGEQSFGTRIDLCLNRTAIPKPT